jgi:hypothetical protein
VDSLLYSNGLSLVRFTADQVDDFVEDLSKENIEEFKVIYDHEPGKAIASVADQPGTYAVMRDGEVLAVTGIAFGSDSSVIWSLFSNKLRKHYARFVRASPALMDFYHLDSDVLYCDIWSKHSRIAMWLMKIGFKPVAEKPHGDNTIVRFVRCKEEQPSGLEYNHRPVMH